MAYGVESLTRRRPAIRGLLVNPESMLVLKFQFNPATIATTKSVNYSVTDVPGWDHPDVVWESGGVKRIKFDLFFDKTQGTKGSEFETLSIPGEGTEAAKAVLESFLYPKKESPLALFGGQKKFVAPPRGILILGLRFFQVVVEGGQEFRDLVFNEILTPERMLAAMSFIVIEEGSINDIAATRRNVIAAAQSAFSSAEVISEVFTTLGPSIEAAAV